MTFWILFALIGLLLLVNFANREAQNDGEPRCSEHAQVLRKIQGAQLDAGGAEIEQLSVVFAVGGEAVSCMVSGPVFQALIQGDEGVLTHQGALFYRFTTSSGQVIE